MDDLKRRDFLKLGGAAVVAGAAPLAGDPAAQTAPAPFSAPPIEMVRIGYVGIGGQGGGHVSNLLKIPGCRITAVCDIRAERTDWATQQITAAGHPRARRLQPRPARLRAAVRDRDRSISSTTRRRGSSTCRSCWRR